MKLKFQRHRMSSDNLSLHDRLFRRLRRNDSHSGSSPRGHTLNPRWGHPQYAEILLLSLAQEQGHRVSPRGHTLSPQWGHTSFNDLDNIFSKSECTLQNDLHYIPRNDIECIPENDLDCYFNSIWKAKNTKFLKCKQTINNFVILQDKIDDEMIEFIMNVGTGKNNIEDNLSKFRNSFFNKDEKNQNIISLIEKVQSIDSIKKLAQVIRILNELNISNLFNLGIIQNYKKPSVYTLNIDEPILSLDIPEEYNNPIKNVRFKIWYYSLKNIHTFITEVWNFHLSDMDNFIENIITFELIISKYVLTIEETLNPLLTSNSIKYLNFINEYDTNDFWKIIFNNYCNEETYITFNNIKYLFLLKKILSDDTFLYMIKNFLVYSIVKDIGIYTSIAQDLTNISLMQYNQKDIFISIMYNTFGFYLQDIYNKKYIDKIKNIEIENMFNKMKSYCIDYFNKTNLFTKKTRKNAIKKLEHLTIIIGSMKSMIDLSCLPTLTNNFYDNYLNISTFFFNEYIKLLNKPTNRKYNFGNGTLSFILNAYYDPRTNNIFVPTSITDNLFFNINASPLYNYGGLGSIIGHEIMHCFDISGSLYDELGYVHNWWTPYDYKKFKIETDKVIKHYSQILVDGMKLNANISIGENMADIAGLKLSLRTYLKNYYPNNFHQNYHIQNEYSILMKNIPSFLQHYNRQIDLAPESCSEAISSDNLSLSDRLSRRLRRDAQHPCSSQHITDDNIYSQKIRNYQKLHNLLENDKEHLKLFFKRWAKIFRSITDDITLEHKLKMDVHAPDIVRINAPFSHIDEYYIIFDVKPYNNNYLEYDKRTKFLD